MKNEREREREGEEARERERERGIRGTTENLLSSKPISGKSSSRARMNPPL